MGEIGKNSLREEEGTENVDAVLPFKVFNSDVLEGCVFRDTRIVYQYVYLKFRRF